MKQKFFVVCSEKPVEEKNKVNRSSYWYRLYNKIYVYRDGPVPYVGKRNHGHYYRRMKTTQERRWSYSAVVDGVPWRARRNARNLPNPWDDIVIGRLKNWKKYRKTQWK